MPQNAFGCFFYFSFVVFVKALVAPLAAVVVLVVFAQDEGGGL
jgi:hypothetical protein